MAGQLNTYAAQIDALQDERDQLAARLQQLASTLNSLPSFGTGNLRETLQAQIAQAQARIAAIDAEIAELIPKRDALDAEAQIRISNGASQEEAYNESTSEYKLKATLLKVLGWAAVVAGLIVLALTVRYVFKLVKKA